MFLLSLHVRAREPGSCMSPLFHPWIFLFSLSLPAAREEEEGWIGINTKTNLFVGKEKLCSLVPVGFIKSDQHYMNGTTQEV